MFNFLASSKSKLDETVKAVTQQAAKAREALGISLLHRPDASQLERQLEQSAQAATTLHQLHDLYVKWIAQLLTSSENDAPLYFDYPQNSFTFDFPSFMLGSTTSPEKQSEKSGMIPPGDLSSKLSWIAPYQSKHHPPPPPHNESPGSTTESADQLSKPPPPPPDEQQPPPSLNPLTFRQVFLRSQALEIALLSVARLEHLRTKLVGPLDEDVGGPLEASTRGALQRLMTLTMVSDGPQKVHRELLFLFCSVDLSSEVWEVHLRHLAELTALLKLDWEEDYYQDRIQRMNNEIDGLKHVLHQVNMPELPSSSSSSSDQASSSSSPSEEKEGASKTSLRFGTEEYDATADAAAAQLEKLCNASRRIAELRLVMDQLIQQSTQRSKVVEETVSKRMAALLSSADGLAQRFLNLQVKAEDKSEVVSHESEAALKKLSEALAEAVSNKASIDAEVQELQRERRLLLSQLQALEERLVEKLTEQRKAHDVESEVSHRKNTLLRGVDHKKAVATELKRQSEMHQLDMKNMKMLIEQSRAVLQSRESQQTMDLRNEKGNVSEQIKSSVVVHLEHEIERLKLSSLRVKSALMRLESLWESRREKEEELKQKRTLEEEAKTAESLSSSSSPPSLSSPPASNRKQLEQLRATVEAASGGLEILNAGFAQAQWRCLNCIGHLDLTWQKVTQFVETVSSHVKSVDASSSSSKVLSELTDNDQDGFVDVGDKDDFVDAHDEEPSSSNRSPSSPLSEEKENTIINAAAIESDMKTLLTTAQSIYVTTKKAVAAKSHLLTDESKVSV